jgi:hypothetical protein
LGELAFAPPTSSPVVPCPSATGPTSIATVKGASHPSAEPSVLPGDACGTALPPAEGQRVRSPDMPSQGSTTSPSGPLLRRCRPSARCFVWPGGREKRPSPRGYSCQPNHSFRTGMPVPTFPPVNGQGVGRPMRHALSTLSGLTPEVLSTPCEVLRLAERPRGASVAEGAFPPAKPFIPPGDARADVPSPPDKAKG